MANFVFNSSGVATRFNVANDAGENGAAVTTAFNWTIPANHTVGRHIVYNESDSSILLDFNLNSGFGVGTNDNAGNTIEILPNNRGLRVAPLSCGIVSVNRATATATAATAATTSATSSARTSHGTSSAVGGRADSNGVDLGERVFIQLAINN